jgi:hypothetical protein
MRIAVHIVDDDGPLFRDGAADSALADLDGEMLDDLFRVADRVGESPASWRCSSSR